MKCNINRNTNNLGNTNLTINQVIAKYVAGHTSAFWIEIIKKTLNCLSDKGGKWIWPNAQLVFTRTGNLYNVETIKF